MEKENKIPNIVVLKNCTVKMLIEYLQTLPQDMPIATDYDICSNTDNSWENEIEVRKATWTDDSFNPKYPDLDFISIR